MEREAIQGSIKLSPAGHMDSWIFIRTKKTVMPKKKVFAARHLKDCTKFTKKKKKRKSKFFISLSHLQATVMSKTIHHASTQTWQETHLLHSDGWVLFLVFSSTKPICPDYGWRSPNPSVCVLDNSPLFFYFFSKSGRMTSFLTSVSPVLEHILFFPFSFFPPKTSFCTSVPFFKRTPEISHYHTFSFNHLTDVNTGDQQCENIVYSLLTGNRRTVVISCHGFGPSFSVAVRVVGSL